MPIGSGPFGVITLGIEPAATADLVPTKLSSSRKLDFATGRYIADADGGVEGMDDVGQRVSLVVAYAAQTQQLPTNLDARFDGQLRSRIRADLAEAGLIPNDIELITVEASRKRAGQAQLLVVFMNKRTNTRQTVAARLSS